MPYLAVKSAMPISQEKKAALQKQIGELISIIPGKTIDNCMTQIEGDCDLYMSGVEAQAVFCEIRMFGPAPSEAKDELGAKLNDLFRDSLGVQKVYINYLEFSEWSTDGHYRAL
ncbi:MAG: phenylpyruvate tautomerase MIF-related protein [Christensenellales bacterium]|jgi:phenylpyruvate tautomerase PptA (4-oxalocrotonate tautomerase family)